MVKKMISYLVNYPAKVINRIILIAGLLIFIPFYSYNFQLVMKVMDLEVVNKLMMSFNSNVFTEIINAIYAQGNIDTFFLIYIVNIISTAGFMLAGFSCTLIIARAINQNSKLSKISYFFPLFVIIVALLDFIASFLFLFIAKNITQIFDWMVFTIDFCYIARIILLYVTFFWIIFACIYLLITKIKSRQKKAV